MGALGNAARVGGLVLLVLAAAGPRAGAVGTVRTVTTGSDSVASPPEGSLRQILNSVAQPGDTIVFAQNFSIKVDSTYRLEVPLALTGITIQGPAELRGGVLLVRGDGTTIANMRFTDNAVFAGTGQNFDDDSRTDDFTFRDNVMVNNSGLELILAADAVIRDNVFDVRAPKGETVVGDFYGDRSRWMHNTWPEGSQGGFAESNGTDFVFDGGNTLPVNAFFAPRSGRIAGNTVKGHLMAYHPDSSVLGPLVIEDNTCGSLGAHRPDLEVVHNTVTGSTPDKQRFVKVLKTVEKAGGTPATLMQKEERVVPFSVGMAQATGDAGYVRVLDNTVTATDGWTSGMLVNATALSTECLVEENNLAGGKQSSLVVNAAKSAVLRKNKITSAGKKGGIVLEGAAVDGLTVEENEVTGGTGAGIVVGSGAGIATLTGNTVKGVKGTALETNGRDVVSMDGIYRDSGVGVQVGKSTTATFKGGTVTGNKGAGLYADSLSSVEVARVVFGGNGGAGIDLAPGNVSINAKKKTANGNMPYPELLEWDPALGRVKGKAEALSRIDAYAVEAGPRAGNTKNGEGTEWLGEVLTGADGKFVFPAAGRLTCPPSSRVTFTATRQGAGIDPATSEFSLDVDCSGVALVLISRAMDGTSPGNDQSSGNGGTLGARYRTVSEDGRFVVFTSRADNLVEGDTNGVSDVFLRDTALGTTTRVSRSKSGGEVTNEYGFIYDSGSAPSISADGRWVCYTSTAEAPFDDGLYYDNDPGVILFDTQTGENIIVANPLQLESPLPSGNYTYGGAYFASVSGDGSAVVFTARSTEYAPDAGDDNDVYVWTRATGAYEKVSVPTGGGDPTNGWQSSTVSPPSLSHDGRFAVFASAHNLAAGASTYGGRAWIRDRQSGTTECASIDAAGGLRHGDDPVVSDDGNLVLFYSVDALAPADTGGWVSVYLRDRQAGTTTLVSRKADGTDFYGDCLEPSISGDGRYLMFRNFGNIWRLDRQTNTLAEWSGSPTVYPNVGCRSPRLSRSGRFLQYETSATNLLDLGGQSFVMHIYLRDLDATK